MVPNPHDAFFKSIFADPEHAGGELQSVLPSALAQALDWTTLSHRPGSFVDPVLSESHTDLLFSVQVQGGGDAFLYLLFEHQSTPDPHMAYRLLRYLVRIWERWRDEHEPEDRLPAIVPVVFYHDAIPWPVPRSFQALVDVPTGLESELRPYIPSFQYLVDDLSQVSEEALRSRAALTALAKLAVVCFKHMRTASDAVEVLRRWDDVLVDVVRASNGPEALERVIRYIVLVNEGVDLTQLQSFFEREVGPEAKEITMTIGEKLIQQGQMQGERRLLLRLLRQRFGDEVGPETERRIAAAEGWQLESWASRVLSATTLAEVLAD